MDRPPPGWAPPPGWPPPAWNATRPARPERGIGFWLSVVACRLGFDNVIEPPLGTTLLGPQPPRSRGFGWQPVADGWTHGTADQRQEHSEV
jgi:hypothetical protein